MSALNSLPMTEAPSTAWLSGIGSLTPKRQSENQTNSKQHKDISGCEVSGDQQQAKQN
jgi:hypothetical protein